MKQLSVRIRITIIFSAIILTPFLALSQYCLPTTNSVNDPEKNHISRIRILDAANHVLLDNNQENSGYNKKGYTDYSNLLPIPTLHAGETYTIILNNINSGDTQYIFWLDYDANERFDFNGDSQTISAYRHNEKIGFIGFSKATEHKLTFTIPKDLPTLTTRLRINMGLGYVNPQYPCSLHHTGEMEDYKVNIKGSKHPFAKDDRLFVETNSGSGPKNQVDVRKNDFVGTDHNGNNNVYSLIESNTPNGGNVSEISDGIFQYIPAPNYLGNDEFHYQICNSAGVCAQAKVKVQISKLQANCVPTSMPDIDGKVRYITHVSLQGENNTEIDNTSGDDGGYGNYTNLPEVELYLGETYPLKIEIFRKYTEGDADSGWAAFIDFNQDGGFSPINERVDVKNGMITYPFLTENIKIPENAKLGETVIRIGARVYNSANEPCGSTEKRAEEFEDYRIKISKKPIPVTLSGNGNPILNGNVVAQVDNHTHFGGVNSTYPNIVREYTIRNNGKEILDLKEISLDLGADTGFQILAQPSKKRLNPNETTTFKIAFSYTVSGIHKATVRVISQAIKHTEFTFAVEAEDVLNQAAAYFNGVTDYLDSPSIITEWNQVTLMAWIKLEAANSNNLPFIYSIAGQENFRLYISKNRQLSLWARTADSKIAQVKLEGTKKLSNDLWYHVTAVFDGRANTLKLYLNGHLMKEKTDVMLKGALAENASGFIVGRYPNNKTGSAYSKDYFKGEIDEVRIFEKALSHDEIRQLVHQEIKNSNGYVIGQITPQTVQDFKTNEKLPWKALKAYYPMTNVFGSSVQDVSDSGFSLKINHNIKFVNQTAPMPFTTYSDGDWSSSKTWGEHSHWDVVSAVSEKASAAIVVINHDLTASSNLHTFGLIVAEDKSLKVKDDVGLYVDRYLNLAGFIDLEGESQLVQQEHSVLHSGENAKLARDQQGTVNLFTYNYWSSPVHSSPISGLTQKNTFSLQDVLKDGTDPQAPKDITFIGGHDGAINPLSIARRWLYKYDNRKSSTYAEWQRISENDRLLVGMGYTMKGTTKGAESEEQNYRFVGQPNNGNIILHLDPGNDYLIGNPYPSAIDGYQFLIDNKEVITGSLLFWEHYGGGSHVLADYEGGYGMYNLSGGSPPVAKLTTPHPDVSQNGKPRKTPGRYIPVAQGFFVTAQKGGDIKFLNSQRYFVPERPDGQEATFFRGTSDVENSGNLELRPKFRINYLSPNKYKRQLLLTIDKNASMDVDWGFDAELKDDVPEDMFWKINNDYYVIQGIDEVTAATVLPLSLKTKMGGIVEIGIEHLENVDETQSVYLKDGDYYHNLRLGNYTTKVEPGMIDGQFQLVFADHSTLSNSQQNASKKLRIYYDQNAQNIVIYNQQNSTLNHVKITSILGQSVYESSLQTEERRIVIPVNVQNSVYIVTVAGEGIAVNQKLLISN